MRVSPFTHCYHCGAQLAPRPADEVLAEAVANFGVFEDPVPICDECYVRFKAWYDEQEHRHARE